jgi:hypothetical protein
VHLEVLIEDKSGAVVMRHLLADMLDKTPHTWTVRPHRGKGYWPENWDAVPKHMASGLYDLLRPNCGLMLISTLTSPGRWSSSSIQIQIIRMMSLRESAARQPAMRTSAGCDRLFQLRKWRPGCWEIPRQSVKPTRKPI